MFFSGLIELLTYVNNFNRLSARLFKFFFYFSTLKNHYLILS